MCTEQLDTLPAIGRTRTNCKRVAQSGGDQLVAQAIPSKPSSAAGYALVERFPATRQSARHIRLEQFDRPLSCDQIRPDFGYLAVLVAFAA
jgi:hypothetical protein